MKKIKKFLNILKINIFKNKEKTLNKYKKLIKEKKKTKKRKYKIQLKLNLNKINKINLIVNIIIYSILIFLLIINTSFFKIKNIQVSTLDENSNTKLIEKNLNKLKNKLIFSIDKLQLKKEILEIEENLKNVIISKRYPNSISVQLESYKSIFKTIINKKKYIITENASIIPAKNIKLNYDILILKHIKLPTFFEYKKVLNIKKLKLIKYISEKLKENILNLKISKIIYYKRETEIHIIINNDTILIFDLNGNIDKKLKQLYVFNTEKRDITKKGIIYIDNRIIGKVFYCEQKDKKQCLNNINFIYNENLK